MQCEEVTGSPASLRIIGISDECEHPKERAQHILAFGNPRYGFDMQRMEREEGRHQRTAPLCAGCAIQPEEQKKRVSNVKEQIDGMESARTGTEILTV